MFRRGAGGGDAETCLNLPLCSVQLIKAFAELTALMDALSPSVIVCWLLAPSARSLENPDKRTLQE